MPATYVKQSRPVIKAKPYDKHLGIPWVVLPSPVTTGRNYLPPPPHAVPAKFEMRFPEEVQACDHMLELRDFKATKPNIKVGNILAVAVSVTGLPIVQSPAQQQTGSSSPRVPTPPVQNRFWKLRASDGSFVPSEGSCIDSKASGQLFPPGKAAGYKWILPARLPSPHIKVEDGVSDVMEVKEEVMCRGNTMEGYEGQKGIKEEDMEIDIKQEPMDD